MQQKNYITFKELYETDFDIVDIYIMRQKWSSGVVFNMNKPRKQTGLIFLNKCKGVYTAKDGSSFCAKEKSLVCLPYGSEYKCLNAECTGTYEDAILLQLNIVKNGKTYTLADSPFLLSEINTTKVFELYNRALAACEASVSSPLALKSAVFELLLYIVGKKAQNHKSRFKVISKGIEMLETNPLSKISIEEIANACNVTPCYFRRLFKEYSSKSPIEYRMEQRLNMAKKMLENGEVTIEYIAEALDFESTSYFCRIFKKKFGITPSQYRKQ